jgi:RHS repeat-associated protein
LAYDYDANLNVKSRTDSVAGVLEQFHYDSLDRLHDWQEVGSYGWGVTYSHDDIGNLTGRSLLGGKGETEALTFEHSGANAGPHAVTSSAWGTYGYNGKGNQTSSPEGTIAYTYFNLPKSIVGTDTTTLKYDASGARVSKSAGTTGTTIYAGGAYERRTVAGSKTHVFYLNASGRQIGEIVRKESDQSETVLYIHSDSLGSSEVVTDVKGQAVGERRKYDPFGAPTDITLPKAFPGESLMSTDVHIGFTGHEEDSETGLINMRGRIYNPKVGHFLTPDPFTSNPFSPVAFNPYAYVLNNPLNYTDPSGFVMCHRCNYGDDNIIGDGLPPAKANPFVGDDTEDGGGSTMNIFDPINWSPGGMVPGVESLGDNKGTMIMRLPGGGWMRSDDAGANASAGGTVYVLGTDGTRMGMPLGTYLDKYEYTGDGSSGQHNQQVRDNRGEISDNPSVQSIANNVNTQPTPMRVGGQSAATSWINVNYHPPAYEKPLEDTIQPIDAILILKALVKIGVTFGITAVVTEIGAKTALEVAGRSIAEKGLEDLVVNNVKLDLSSAVVNPKIYLELEKQLAKDGPDKIFKSLGSAAQTLAEHVEKLPTLQYKSAVEKTISNVANQVMTLFQFISDKGLQ